MELGEEIEQLIGSKHCMKIHHIAIICSDYEVSKKFYTEVLGLNIIREVYREERQSYKLDLAIGEHYVIELFSFPNPPARPSRPESCGLRHLAFSVDSVVDKRNELMSKVVLAKAALSNNQGEGYIDTAVKILIAVVLGALLLAGLYALFGDVVMPTLEQRIRNMFNFAG